MMRVRASRFILLCSALLLFLSGCERLAWREARKENTAEAYERYLSEYPRGRHSGRAWKYIQGLEFRSVRRDDTIEAYTRYITEFPDSDFAKNARMRLKHLAEQKTDALEADEMKKARIKVITSMGSFTFKLFPKAAPRHCRNIIYLALIDFYKDLKIHWVYDNLVQMGDPRGDGLGGPGYMIPAEMSDKKHKRGTVSMFHYPEEPDTAGSQFFVCIKDMPDLDGKYTVFGEVVEGMEVLDEISKVETRGKRSRDGPVPVQPIYIRDVKVLLKP